MPASGGERISLALGLPDTNLFPRESLARAASQTLADVPEALQYGAPFAPLKEHIVELMRRRGVECRQEQIFLTCGAQQGLSLLARLLLGRGGQVLLEQMAYTGFQQALMPLQPQILSVPSDPQSGIDVDAVEAMLEAGARPALIYAVTDGHNPLGLSVSREKRLRLVELACRYGVPIIEDDAYGFIHYGERAEPPLRALDGRWVFYVGSFSKILAPSLRAGWLVVPEELIPVLSILKESSDINTSTFTQRIISAFLDTGELENHVSTLRGEYRARRDVMSKALGEHFPAAARWTLPTSGIFFWVELPARADTTALLGTAVEMGVTYIPGNAFCVDNSGLGLNCMRLNFSHCAPALLEEGIARLGRLLKSALA